MNRTGATTARTAVRSSLVRSLVILTVVTVGAILLVGLRGARGAAEHLTSTLVESAAERTKDKLASFFDPVRTDLLTARDWGRAGMLGDDDERRLNALFMPLLENAPQVSSVMVSCPGGREYLLLRKDDHWMNRRVHVDAWGSRARITRWKDLDTRIDAGTDTGGTDFEEIDLDYDPRKRPWHEGALALRDESEVHWTAPYTFFTTKELGITASTRWTDDDGGVHVVAFDVLLADVSRFTMSLEVSARGRAAVVTPQGRVVGLPKDPRFEHPDALRDALLERTSDLGVPAFGAAMQACAHMAPEDGAVPAFQFDLDGETWWGGATPYVLGGPAFFWIGVVVPEADFMATYERQRNQGIVLALLAVGLAIGVALVLARRIRSRVDREMDREMERVRKLGQYTLEEEIGEGGIGTVYRARHAMLRRPTAVKLLRPEQAGSEQALARFEREVQATARLTNPHTIAIYDYGRTPEGVFYYAMEYLEGVSLQTLVDQGGPLPAARVIHILRQACESLAEAHEAGMVHRDVKPANLMLCRRGGLADVVKVLDFGLVKQREAADDVAITQAGMISGTPLYLPPEAMTSPDKVDQRSDLYALAAVGFFLLTGRVLFPGSAVMEVLTAHLRDEPQRPSDVLGKPVPVDLEDVVLACLAKKQADRPATARELSTMLAGCADATGWTQSEAAAWWDDHGVHICVTCRDEPKEIGTSDAALAVDLHSRQGD